jgi:hypothetical protein
MTNKQLTQLFLFGGRCMYHGQYVNVIGKNDLTGTYTVQIKRTRKQQIAKAKHMMDWHNHTSYEWSQWWKKSARKPKRGKNNNGVN